MRILYISTEMRFWATLCGVGLWAFSAWSQGTPLPFEQISTQQGLSDNAITKLFQDRDGFLWIGTENGLNRFDGHHIRSWHATDGLVGEHVTDILQDHNGTIWVSTHEGGLTRISAVGDVLASYRPDHVDPKAIANLRLTCLFDLNDSILMIGAQRSPVIFFQKRTGIFTYWNGTSEIAPADAVAGPINSNDWCNYIRDLGDDRMVIGFLLGLQQWVVDRGTGKTLGPAFRLDILTDQTIVDVARVGDRLYGAGWQKKLHVHDMATGLETTWPMPDECTEIAAEDSLHLLIGTATSGLLRINLGTGTLEVFRHRQGEPRSISDDRIRALLRDREGRIWVGTQNGLNLYAPQRWWSTTVPFFLDDRSGTLAPHPFSIAELKDGELDICTTIGLFRYPMGGPLKHFPLSDGPRTLRATSMLDIGKEKVLGTEEGVFSWWPKDGSLTAWPLHSAFTSKTSGTDTDRQRGIPPLFQVRSILSDTVRGSPTLVLGVLGYGIALLDLDRQKLEWFTNIPDDPASIGSNLTNVVVRDRAGDYWAGTSEGLYEWRLDHASPTNTFLSFRADSELHPLPSNDILALLADDRGMIWIGTRNGGLAYWDGNTMRSFPLPSSAGSTVYGLALDHDGRLWCAGRGCFAVLDTATKSWAVIPLQGTQDLPSIPLCMQALHDGRIAFISDNALQLFDPLSIRPLSTPPQPYLTELDLAGTSAMGRIRGGVLELDPDEGLLRVAVSALDLSPLSPYQFTFELEGVDPSPRYSDENGSLVYASLPSGTYRLLARTIGPNGAYGTPVQLALISKAAPLWQRWWFYLLLIALTAFVAYAASRYRYRQKMKLQQVRNRIASDLHDEVGSSLSAISIGSQLAAQLGGGSNAQVSGILARIGETSSESLRSISDIVWAIDPKNDEGEALLKRMRRIAQELLESKGIAVRFNLTGRVEELKLPMNARKELLLIYKEAVHNASKHAEALHVTINLSRMDHKLTLSVMDDGKGFDPALHPDGHGLGSMQRRALTVGGILVLDSAPGNGTSVGIEVDLTRISD